MKVKFLKYTRWSFNGTIRTYEKGDIEYVPEKEAQQMIKASIAEEIKEEKSLKLNIEDKMLHLNKETKDDVENFIEKEIKKRKSK